MIDIKINVDKLTAIRQTVKQVMKNDPEGKADRCAFRVLYRLCELDQDFGDETVCRAIMAETPVDCTYEEVLEAYKQVWNAIFESEGY